MMAFVRRFGPIAAFLLVGLYAVIALRGPNGITALMQKRREIQQLESQNATLALENQRKRSRIERLKTNPSEQELEIRKQLKLLRPGETSFILPEPSEKPQAPAPPSPAQ
jgi:cell division protein FtsB